jgi:EcoRII C terminal
MASGTLGQVARKAQKAVCLQIHRFVCGNWRVEDRLRRDRRPVRLSENQTAEMQAKSLQLVLPKKLHETYKPAQQGKLMELKDFVALVQKSQS